MQPPTKTNQPKPANLTSIPRPQCKCDGFQRRSVKCYDEITKTESIRCPETRPYQKRKCEPAQDCRQRYSKSVAFSCADVQRIRRTRADGEYTLSVQGRPVSVYCHNMTSNAPAEYVTLKSGECMETVVLNLIKSIKTHDIIGFLEPCFKHGLVMEFRKIIQF